MADAGRAEFGGFIDESVFLGDVLPQAAKKIANVAIPIATFNFCRTFTPFARVRSTYLLTE